MKAALTILFLICGLNLFAQIDLGYDAKKISKNTKKIIRVLKKVKRIEGSSLGFGGTPSKTYPHFEELLNTATEQELIELTKIPNANIRYYAFWGLIRKETDLETLYQITINHLNDTKVLETQSFCIVGDISIGDYMLSSIKDTDEYNLSDNQIYEIDSLLFWNENNKVEERNEAFSRMKKTTENYEQLKKIVSIERNPNALIPLLSYQVLEDRKFIKKFIKTDPFYAFEAATSFPQHELKNDFRIFLNKKPDNYSNQTWIALYKAVLKLPEDTAISIILNTFNTSKTEYSKKKHAEYINWATQDNHSKFLIPVKITISKYLKNMTVENFNDLWNADSVKTFQFIKEKFENEVHPYYNEKLINAIIDKVEILKGDSAILFLNQGIEKGYSITYYTLAARASKYNNPQTNEILINRFNSDIMKNDYDLYYRSKGILNYNSEIVFKGIENKVFSIIETKNTGKFAAAELVELSIKSNKERAINVLLKLIKENNKDGDFLRVSVYKLIKLNENDINQKLLEIYNLSDEKYKNTYFGLDFYSALHNNKQI